MTTLEITLYLLGAANIACYANQKGGSVFWTTLFWPALTVFALVCIAITAPLAWYVKTRRQHKY